MLGAAVPDLTGVPNHDGSPRDPADVLFGIPTDIGTLQSATTSISPGKPPPGLKASDAVVFGVLVGGGGGFFVGWGVEYLVAGLAPWGMVGGAVAGALALSVLFARKPPDTCTFVGSDGVAVVTRRGGRHDVQRALFRDVSQLRIKNTDQRVNGAHVGTLFRYELCDRQGTALLKVSGGYPPEGDPVLSDPRIPLHFARAIEGAWKRWQDQPDRHPAQAAR